MSVTIKSTNKIPELLKNLKKLGHKEIQVGLFGNDDSELVMIGAVHEYGTEIKVTPKMRAWFAYNGYPLKQSTEKIVIPERSFLRSGFDENINKIAKKIEDLLPSVLENEVDSKVFMDAIGLEFASLIQKKIRDLQTPPNSAMTVKKKGSSNPLIDTGRLVESIRYKVE